MYIAQEREGEAFVFAEHSMLERMQRGRGEWMQEHSTFHRLPLLRSWA